MAKELATDTYVTDKETGQSEMYPAGTKASDIPKEMLDQINNESAWGDSEEEIDKETGDPVQVHDYSSKSAQELTKMADERGLVLGSKKKEDLVAALEEHDKTRSNVEIGEVP